MENMFDKTLHPKYAVINFGYFPTYLKTVLKLFIQKLKNFINLTGAYQIVAFAGY